jgi:hypothetical protein
MAGQLTIDTLRASSGVLATQNGMTGICKAWVRFNGSQVIASSFNVSSITNISTGYYQVNFTTTLPDANYSAIAMASDAPTCARVTCQDNNNAPTTSSFRFYVFQSNNGAVITGALYTSAMVFGN